MPKGEVNTWAKRVFDPPPPPEGQKQDPSCNLKMGTHNKKSLIYFTLYLNFWAIFTGHFSSSNQTNKLQCIKQMTEKINFYLAASNFSLLISPPFPRHPGYGNQKHHLSSRHFLPVYPREDILPPLYKKVVPMCGEVGGKGSFREKTKLLILEETEKMGRGPFTLLAYLSYLSLKERGGLSTDMWRREKKGGLEQIEFPHSSFLMRLFFRPLCRISVSIVWLFIVCHVWKLVPTVYELLNSEVSGLESFS